MASTKQSNASTKGLDDLFLDGLKDIYYAEKKILKALPKMARGADAQEVSAAFEKHRTETEAQVDRLEQIFELLDKPARGKTCPAIDGILEEGSEILEEYKGSTAIDAGLGSGLIDQSQKMTVAAMQMAEKKVWEHRS